MRKLRYGSICPLYAFICSLLTQYRVSWIWILGEELLHVQRSALFYFPGYS